MDTSPETLGNWQYGELATERAPLRSGDGFAFYGGGRA